MSAAEKVWRLSPEQTAHEFTTDMTRGLSAGEAQKRLATFGRNTIESTHQYGALKTLLNQFKSPLIIVLLVAGTVTLAIAHYQDAIFIFIAVAINAILGFVQENKAERALASLKSYLKQRARVIRDGEEREIDAEELVPGDLIRLAQGDRVPADARIIFVNDLQVDEAVLTGESLPVGKTPDASPADAGLADRSCMIFAGTLVTQGVASGLVSATAASTEFGKIASAVAGAAGEKTPLQVAIIRFSLYLSILIALFTLVVFVLGILAGYSALEMFLISVAIAVSAIPEGLPVSMTVILAVGVERMAKRKGVVRKLVAAEALGSTTVILTDKTGTLTMAQMMLSKIIAFKHDEKTLLTRALANTDVLIENPQEPAESWRVSGRIMEVALVRAAGIRGMTAQSIMSRTHVLQSSPFNAVRKYSVSLVAEGGTHRIMLVGAPDILLQHAALSAPEKTALAERISELAASGERVLGLASKEIVHSEDFSLAHDLEISHLSFDGLLTFRDPVRPGIRQTMERVQAAGIRTIIMTGDHRGTAQAIAREIGMAAQDDAVLDASELALLSDEALRERLPRLSVISRVTPFDKLRIAKLLQSTGEVVAMTGDGVNDAPSIKQANVGIAMGSGTEVARSVADLVLLDDNFETIVAAIEEGRQILSNIRKVLVYLLTNVADELILIGGALLTGLPLPLNALQILWVNFFADSFPAMAYAFEKDPDALARQPHRGTMRLFDPLTKFLILVIGISTSALLFILYFILMRLGVDEALVRTFIFAAFGTYTLLVALALRSLEKSIFSYPFFSNPLLTIGVAIGIALMAAAIYLPPLQTLFGTVALPWQWILAVAVVGVANIALIEAAKYFFRESRV